MGLEEASPPVAQVRLQEQEQEQEQEQGQGQESIISETQAAPAVRLNTTSTVEERFTEAQANARRLGKDPSLQWIYDESDELHGASCGDVFFSREELLELSRSSCWAGR